MLAAALAAAALLATSAAASLPGLRTGKAPWDSGWAHLAHRLGAIGLPALTAEGEVVHIHQHLDIYVAGRRVALPAGVGFGVGLDQRIEFVSPLHTHDASGVVHVESPSRRSYTLGQLFDVWGVRLTPGCVGGYCATGRARLRVFANGKAVAGDPRALVLTSHEEIVVAYGTQAQLPEKIPAAYAFAPGL